ncbi:DedA family protein [Polyangium aurulentum]|uniref:DedA family protein n=1 Tax=Polyangium aurulentum TaxID=2567896 RepID=UPI0010AE23C7|nr:DedA family protein [Polyangium aurulentum]UQA58159.1 DedA family protein [Polyangium aurulentum]
MAWLLSHGSYALLYAALVVAGFGVPIPEEIVVLSGGVLAHRRVTAWTITLVVIFLGLLSGDMVLFSMARRLGPAALDRPGIARLLTPARRARIEALFARYGGAVVVAGRHMPGVRPAVIAMAGANGMHPLRFLAWDALGASITCPIVFGLGYLFSDRLDLVRRDLARVEHVLLLLAVLGFAAHATIRRWQASAAR